MITLLEVIEAGGYDITQRDDANWLLSKQREFGKLIEQAEEVVEASDE